MSQTLGIIVGGGPAPGINGVISAVTIEAINSGMKVVGFMDGFKHLVSGEASKNLMPLSIDDVSRINNKGGSLLRTSRISPIDDAVIMNKVLAGLKSLKIDYLVTIGGEGTATVVHRLDQAAKGVIHFVHVPKTIDNDLPLPGSMPTFGFETARHVGTNLLANLIEDAKTTRRWFFVVTMGRLAGHLSLGIAKAAGATLAVIPEEFGEKVALDSICNVLEGAIIKRLAAGRDYGVAVIAEGLADKLSAEDLKALKNVREDDYGHLRLSEVGFSEFLKRRVEKSLQSRGLKIPITDKNIGYELRCAPPIPFDTEYTRDLGYAAVRFLIHGGSGAMVALLNGKTIPIPLRAVTDPQTQRTRVRLVEISSDGYQAALSYMIRLKRKDFESAESVRALAKAAAMETGDFEKRFKSAAV